MTRNIYRKDIISRFYGTLVINGKLSVGDNLTGSFCRISRNFPSFPFTSAVRVDFANLIKALRDGMFTPQKLNSRRTKDHFPKFIVAFDSENPRQYAL